MLKSAITYLLTIIVVLNCLGQKDELSDKSATVKQYSIKDVKRFWKSSSGTLYKNGTPSGSYHLTFSDRAGKGDWYYTLTVLDENLNRTTKKDIRMPKRTFLVDAANSEDFIFLKFYSYKDKNIVYRFLKTDGSEAFKKTREANKVEKKTYNIYDFESPLVSNNINRGNVGFVDLIQQDKSGYQLKGLDNRGNVKWTHEVEGTKGYKYGVPMAGDDDGVVVIETNKKSRSAKRMTLNLYYIDNSGKVVFDHLMQGEQNSLIPFNVNFRGKNKNILVTGEYYKDNERVLTNESEGMFFLEFDRSGKITSEKYLNWKKDVKPLIKSTDEGILNNSLYFHNFQRLADGRIIAVAEQYKKQVSAAGAAAQGLAVLSAMSGSRAGVTTDMGFAEVKIGNILVFTFNEKLDLKQVDLFEKKKRKYNLGQGNMLVGKHYFARILKALDQFGYTFSQVNEDRDIFTFIFRDVEKLEGKLFKRVTLNAVTFKSQEGDPIFTDVWAKKGEGEVSQVYPSKSGYIQVGDYYKKEKKYNLTLTQFLSNKELKVISAKTEPKASTEVNSKRDIQNNNSEKESNSKESLEVEPAKTKTPSAKEVNVKKELDNNASEKNSNAKVIDQSDDTGSDQETGNKIEDVKSNAKTSSDKVEEDDNEPKVRLTPKEREKARKEKMKERAKAKKEREKAAKQRAKERKKR